MSSVTSALIAAAANRMICMKSWYWRRKARNPDSFLAPASRLGPLVPSRDELRRRSDPFPVDASSRATSAVSSVPVLSDTYRGARGSRHRTTSLSESQRFGQLLRRRYARAGASITPFG